MSRRPPGRRFRPAKGSGKAVSASMIQQAVSTRSDPFEAVRELHAAIARQPLGLAVVFCSKRYDKDSLEQAFLEVFGDAPLVGCTTAGEVSALGYTDGTMTGLGLAAEACVAVSELLPEISSFKPAQGRAVVASLLGELRRQGIEPTPHDTFGLLLIDGMRLVEEQVISTLNAALNGLPLFGGSAGDDMSYVDSQVLYQGRFHSNAAILTLVHTHLPFKVFSSQHFVGVGEQAIVTAADSDRRIITELNGECAALEYARLLGRDIEELRTQEVLLAPLVVRIGGSWYARSPEHLNDDNSLQLACAIDEGVPLSIGRNTGMIPNLQKTFETIHAAIGPPVAVLGFDCVVRRMEANTFGLQADVARLFAANRVIGFSAYGEQINGMHLNHTFTGVAFGRPAGVRTPAPACAAAAAPPDGGEAARLESENAKLRKTVRVLLQRIERSMNLPSDTFSLFQNNVLLETTIQRRTEEMAELNRKLNQELIARRETDAALTAAKAEAERANLSKTKFLASVSHDLQQPLNAARLLLGALMEEKLSTSGRSLLGRIEGALEAAEEMLADFLDVAKLESGGVTAHSAHFAISQLLSQLEAEYTPQARRKGLVLTIVQSSAVLYSDKGLLQRILRNLLANAVRYTRRGRILVGCRRDGERLLVEVHDTGIGIPADRLQEVFQPYLRIDGGAPDTTRGSGLGLTIAKNIADILGLTLSVRSAEGTGSTFTIGIPMGDRALPPEQTPARQGSTATLAGRRILILDDDSHSREALAAALGGWGCEVLVAATVEEAGSLARQRPDLLIMDYHLDDAVTALDALDTLRGQMDAAKPVLVISADRTKAVGDQVKRRGLEFLSKPINPARLRSLVTYLLCCPATP